SLALIALISGKLGTTRWTPTIAMLGVIATALVYGDAIITSAISVLSAGEGSTLAPPGFEHLVVPIAVGLLAGLFAIQSHGTALVGKLFGPVMVVYFIVLAVLGIP